MQNIGQDMTDFKQEPCGVPQGNVLGLSFFLYT